MSGLKRIIHEIHRRSLWQVLGVYLAASWVALQVVDTMADSMTLPDWVPPFAIVLLVLGLPVVLATAFVQEGVGRGPVRAAVAGRAGGERGAPEPATGYGDADGAPSPAPTPESAGAPGRGRGLFTWPRAVLGGVGAFSLLALVLVGWVVLRSLGIGPAGTLVAKGVLEEQATLVLADFAAEDPSLAHAATEAFRVDLDQSTVIDLADPTFVTLALARMERDPEANLDVETGRELAVREGLPAVIAGDIAAAGSGYVLTARVVGAHDGQVLVSDRETAGDDSELVSAIDRLSKKLRERIGESLRDLAGGPPLERVTTRDLEALRLYSRAVRATERGEDQEAAELLEETVARDSTFAMAWRKLGMIHVSGGGGLGQRTRGVEALRTAYELRDRLTERERLLGTAGFFSNVEIDNRRAARAYDQLLELDPDDNWALNNLAIIVGPEFGEYERSVDLLERAMATDTLSRTHHWNLSVAQVNVGDFEAARATLEAWRRRLPTDPLGPWFLGWLEAAERDFEAADRYARESGEVRPGNVYDEALENVLLAFTAAIRGRLEVAAEHLGAAERAHAERGAPGEALNAGIWGAEIRVALAGDHEGAAARMDAALARHPLEDMGPLDPRWGRLSETWARVHGTDGGDRMVRRWTELDPNAEETPAHGYALAWVALAAGEAAEAIRRLRAAETPECQPCAQPLLAAAFEAAGERDSAIAYYERYLERPYLFRAAADASHLGPGLERLARLYDEGGDLENAAKYYAMFVELWAEADDELQPRVRAAQARLEEILRERG